MTEEQELKCSIGASIKTLLTQRGMTQKELARKVGCSQAYVSQLIAGKRNPTLTTLLDLAHALGSDLSVHIHSR